MVLFCNTILQAEKFIMNRNILSPGSGVGEARGSGAGFGEGFRLQQIKNSADRCALILTNEAYFVVGRSSEEAAASLNAEDK